MGVNVDKARRDDLARHIQLARVRDLVNAADGGNAVAGNRDIGTAPRLPAAVDDLTPAQDPIGHFSPRHFDVIAGYTPSSARARHQASNSAKEALAKSGSRPSS